MLEASGARPTMHRAQCQTSRPVKYTVPLLGEVRTSESDEANAAGRCRRTPALGSLGPAQPPTCQSR